MLVDHLGTPIIEGSIVFWSDYKATSGQTKGSWMQDRIMQYVVVYKIKTNAKGDTILSSLPITITGGKNYAVGVREPRATTVIEIDRLPDRVRDTLRHLQQTDDRYHIAGDA